MQDSQSGDASVGHTGIEPDGSFESTPGPATTIVNAPALSHDNTGAELDGYVCGACGVTSMVALGGSGCGAGGGGGGGSVSGGAETTSTGCGVVTGCGTIVTVVTVVVIGRGAEEVVVDASIATARSEVPWSSFAAKTPTAITTTATNT